MLVELEIERGWLGSWSATNRLGWADLPMGVGRQQLLGVSLLCGIGFTMSLLIGLLAVANAPVLQTEVKIGILGGSILSGLLGWLVLRFAASARRSFRRMAVAFWSYFWSQRRGRSRGTLGGGRVELRPNRTR